MTLPQVHLTGRLTADPQITFTSSGAARTTFSVACSERRRNDAGEWVDADITFVDCVAWRRLAENIVESLTKGTEVTLSGEWKTRRYEAKDGSTRTAHELEVRTIGPNLAFATAQVTRNSNNAAPSAHTASAGHTAAATAGQRNGNQATVTRPAVDPYGDEPF